MIYKWDKWIELNEDRTSPITLEQFISIYNNNKLNNDGVLLFKNILEPKSNILVFNKKRIQLDYLPSNKNILKEAKFCLDNHYPLKTESLTCYNYETIDDDTNSKTFIVFPLKGSLFSIRNSKKDYLNKGYWKNNVKWLTKENQELWTDSKCILIEKNFYYSHLDKINKQVEVVV